MDFGLPTSDCSATIAAVYNDTVQKRRKRSVEDAVPLDAAAASRMTSQQNTPVLTKSPGSPETGDTQQHSSTHCEHTSNSRRAHLVIDDSVDTVTGLLDPKYQTSTYPPSAEGVNDPNGFRRHSNGKRSRTSFDYCAIVPHPEPADAIYPSSTNSYASTARPGASTWSEHTATDSAWPQPSKSQHTGSMASETLCISQDSPSMGPEGMARPSLSVMPGGMPGILSRPTTNTRRLRKAMPAAGMQYPTQYQGAMHPLPMHRVTADGGLRPAHSMHVMPDGAMFSSLHHSPSSHHGMYAPTSQHSSMHSGGPQSDNSPVVPVPPIAGLQHAASAPLPDIWRDIMSPSDIADDGPDEGWLTAREFYDLFSADRRPVRLPQIIIQDITKDLIEDYRALQALKRTKGDTSPPAAALPPPLDLLLLAKNRGVHHKALGTPPQ